jgi:hypothetical protein
MKLTTVTYAAFKIALAGTGAVVTYAKRIDSFVAMARVGEAIIKTDVLMPDDVKDFELEVIPTSTLGRRT